MTIRIDGAHHKADLVVSTSQIPFLKIICMGTSPDVCGGHQDTRTSEPKIIGCQVVEEWIGIGWDLIATPKDEEVVLAHDVPVGWRLELTDSGDMEPWIEISDEEDFVAQLVALLTRFSASRSKDFILAGLIKGTVDTWARAYVAGKPWSGPYAPSGRQAVTNATSYGETVVDARRPVEDVDLNGQETL